MEVCLKDRNNKSRFEFRVVAREVTREFYDIPEENKALFAYQLSRSLGPSPSRGGGFTSSHTSGWPATGRGWGGGRKKAEVSSKQKSACGVLSMSLATTTTSEPDTMFDSDFFHHITFLFVKPDYQQMGVGRKLVETALKQMADHAPERPVRVESALGAARFFEKLGFQRTAEPYQTACAGSRLFQNIVYMEHASYQTEPDSFPT